jgi:hypothetical protein
MILVLIAPSMIVFCWLFACGVIYPKLFFFSKKIRFLLGQQFILHFLFYKLERDYFKVLSKMSASFLRADITEKYQILKNERTHVHSRTYTKIQYSCGDTFEE